VSAGDWYDPQRPIRRQAAAWASVLAVILVLAWWFWPSITRVVVVHDLRTFSTKIRQSGFHLRAKIEVLDQMDDIEHQLDQGRSIGLLKWRATSSAIEEILADEETVEEVVPLIQRELRQVERRLR
jgi:hypothetical protein